MSSGGAEDGRLRLHRLTNRDGYRFELAGTRYRVRRSTDGTLGSAVIWDVELESEPGQPVRSFTTLADLRRRFDG